MIDDMLVRLPRISAAIVLSIALMYSGVAWAIDNCLSEHAHAAEDVAGHHHDEHDREDNRDSHHSSNPIVHCSSLFHHPGPSTIVPSFNLSKSGKALPLYFSSILDILAPQTKTNLWLQSLFERNLTVPFPTDRPHLFLSVLQI